jgi:hypothetical protein
MPAGEPQEPVLAFVATCERFLSLCIDDPRPEIERLWSLRSTLSALVAGIDRLPVSWDPYDFRESPTYVGYYHDVLNPLDVKANPEAAIGDTIDDLVDIYRELLCGLALVREGRPREAVGHWLNGFYSHWGDHAIGALRAIHAHLQVSGWLPPSRTDDQGER